MGLIKSANTPTNVAPFSMADIARQAAAIMARAQHRADAMLIEAQRAGAELRQAAHADGLQAGHDEGHAKGLEEGRALGRSQALEEHREELDNTVKGLIAACTDIDAQRRELEAGVLHEVTQLSLKVAARITKRQALFEPQVLEANLVESLKLVIGTHRLRVAIHPAQKATLTEVLPRLKLDFPTLDHVELIEDPTIAPGGCRLHLRQGQIDATLDEQLMRIAMDLMPGSPTDG
jgi:flagellar assembly protein FliH